MKTRDESIREAVRLVKNSQYKATGIKVELEAELGRIEGGDACGECNGEGFLWCRNCIDREPEDIGCYNCSEGQIQCDECYGERADGIMCIQDCYEHIMQGLQQYGLSEYDETRFTTNHRRNYKSNWHPKGALAYLEFYNDGSVDSEVTFTIKLNKIDNIFLLPKIIGAFKELADYVGNGLDIDGAGMHMALINTKECTYDPDHSPAATQIPRFRNFKRSMQLLLPALYFLGSSTNASRGIEYRYPQVEQSRGEHGSGRYNEGNGKYSAVSYRGGSVEFRVFETCYDNPDQILDNFVVISKCMRYWRTKYKPSGIGKIYREIKFGNDEGRELNRFYQTIEHVEVLNAGLRKLKPDYLKISDIKKQRQFKTTKRTIDSNLKKRERDAELGYKEYEERFQWSLRVRESTDLSQYLSEYNVPADQDKAIEEARAKVSEEIERRRAEMTSKTRYIREAISSYKENCQGRFTLREES